jgi:hypothetical protein
VVRRHDGRTGTTSCNGGITLDGAGQKGLSRTLNNPATATWTDGNLRIFVAGGVWNNSGTLDAQADGTGSTLFDAGTFHNTARSRERRSPTFCSLIRVRQRRHRRLADRRPEVRRRRRADHEHGIVRRDGQRPAVRRRDLRPRGGATVTGTTVEFTGATVNTAGPTTSRRHERDRGAAHFTGTVTSVGTALTISGGTADFSSGEAIAPTTLTFTNGTLTGSDNINVSGLTIWSAGTMDGSGATHCNGGMTLDGAGQKGLSRTLTSAGSSTWTDGNIRIFVAGGDWTNTGTFDAQGDSTSILSMPATSTTRGRSSARPATRPWPSARPSPTQARSASIRGL